MLVLVLVLVLAPCSDHFRSLDSRRGRRIYIYIYICIGFQFKLVLVDLLARGVVSVSFIFSLKPHHIRRHSKEAVDH